MPSRSQAQHNLMAMVAHDPKAAKRLKIPQSVGQEYVAADKGKKFSKGGAVDGCCSRAVRSGKISPKQYVAGEKSEGETEPGMMARAKALKSGKMSPAAYAAHEKTEKKPAAKKMACGGAAKKPAAKKMAAGGKVRGCGVAVKGKTKGKMV